MNRSRSWIYLVILKTAFLSGAAEVHAELEPHEVLLVYNSLHPESNEIAQYYMQARPGVIPLDLEITYISGNPQEPGLLAANNRHITPQAFLDWIRTPILGFIRHHEDGEHIVSIVTTRGIPAVVTTDFTIGAGHVPGSGAGDALPSVRGGVESLLARLGFGTESEWENILDLQMDMGNPYFMEFNVPFRDFITGNSKIQFCAQVADGSEYAGKLFLVTRLDSDRPNPASHGEPEGTHVDGVKALIDRSQNLIVNKFSTTLVVDNNNPENGPQCGSSQGGGVLGPDREGLQYMHAAGWCTHYDQTDEFMFGADSPYANYGLEHLSYPVLLHASFGRNNHNFCAGDLVDRCYVSGLVPHPAGLFISVESYNGHSIRTPAHAATPPDCGTPGVGAPHGQALRWIARGGSFASGSVVGHGSAQIMQADYVLANLYEHGMSWAEAAYSSLRVIGHYQTPIGDPLAVVTVYDPDINGDGLWDIADVELLEIYISQGDLRGDVNGDGVVDELDMTIVADFNGRDCSADPMASTGSWPIPASGVNRHGDVNADGFVDRDDLDRVVAGFGQYCSNDATGDGIFDEYDVLSVLCNWGRVTGDVNRDCFVNVTDLLAVSSAQGECPWPCMEDIASGGWNTPGPNGIVDSYEITLIMSNWGNNPACNQPPESADIESIPIEYIDPAWLTLEGGLDPAACDLLDHWFGNPAYK